MGPDALDNVFRCSECDTIADSLTAMSGHYQRMHGDVFTLIRCCDALFFSREVYHSHCHKFHSGHFICDQCKDTFKTRASLNVHRLTFVKTYTCPLCGFRAPKLPKIKRHIEQRHAVILDQGYILVGLDPTHKDGKDRKTRLILRKMLKLVVPCCTHRAVRATGSLLANDELERSYTCGLVSPDVFDSEFVESREVLALTRAASLGEAEALQDSQEDPETADSASGFFNVAAEESAASLTDVLKVGKLLNYALTKTVAAVGIF